MKTFLLCLLWGSLNAAVHVIGDSHCFEFSQIKGCILHHLGPRTMHRVGRDGLALLDFKSLGVQEKDTVILTFGEIDARCHIGLQRDLYGRELNEIIDTLLENYFKTLLANRGQYQEIKIVTYTVTPPVLVSWNIYYESYGPIEDRVMISRLLNQKLIEMAHRLGFEVIDVYQDYADERGVLIEKYSDGSVHIDSSHSQAIQHQLQHILR